MTVILPDHLNILFTKNRDIKLLTIVLIRNKISKSSETARVSLTNFR